MWKFVKDGSSMDSFFPVPGESRQSGDRRHDIGASTSPSEEIDSAARFVEPVTSTFRDSSQIPGCVIITPKPPKNSSPIPSYFHSTVNLAGLILLSEKSLGRGKQSLESW